MDLSPHDFDDLRSTIHRLCGLSLSDDKQYLIRQRLEPIAKAAQCSTFAEFRDKLRGPAATALRDQIIAAITTNETSFFRDGHPFDTLRRFVFPQLINTIRDRKRSTPIVKPPVARIWCSAASTGQEPYTVAILVRDLLESYKASGFSPADVTILATDISSQALAAAMAGKYAERDLQRGLPPELVSRCFRFHDGMWIIKDEYRAMVDFQRMNLVEPFSQKLGVYDIVLCRNVLIYFDDDTKRRIIQQIHTLLAPNGWLMLGSAENLYGISDLFVSRRLGETIIYQKPPKDPIV